MVDEFTYPDRVQEAIDFIERETKAEQHRRSDERRDRRDREQYRQEPSSRYAQAQREADSNAKFWETRRKQQAAQQQKRRFQPANPDGWTQ